MMLHTLLFFLVLSTEQVIFFFSKYGLLIISVYIQSILFNHLTTEDKTLFHYILIHPQKNRFKKHGSIIFIALKETIKLSYSNTVYIYLELNNRAYQTLKYRKKGVLTSSCSRGCKTSALTLSTVS